MGSSDGKRMDGFGNKAAVLKEAVVRTRGWEELLVPGGGVGGRPIGQLPLQQLPPPLWFSHSFSSD